MNILIIEDDILLASHISLTFKKSWFANRVQHISSYGDFLSMQPLISSYDIFILDISLWNSKNKNGLDILNHVRKVNINIPIIMISSHSEYEFLEEAFAKWANDYIIKPFRSRELQIRIKRWFRNYLLSEYFSVLNDLEYEDLRYNISKNMFYYRNTKINLSRWSKYVLSLLLMYREKLVSHNFLIEKIWWFSDDDYQKNVRIKIMRLKNSLKEFHLDAWIQTIKGEGYILKKN